MKINFLGDSITAGVGTEWHEQSFADIVCKFFHAEECNFGVSGTRIAAQTKPSECSLIDETFLTRAKKMPKDSDFTFVFGGTNDFGHGDAPLGEYGDRGEYTFYGAFYSLAEYVKSVYGKKLCFILPLPRHDQDNPLGEWSKKKTLGALLSDYILAEKKILSDFQIDFIDLTDLFPVPLSSQGNEWTADGAHPNPEGNIRIANELIRYLKFKFNIIKTGR